MHPNDLRARSAIDAGVPNRPRDAYVGAASSAQCVPAPVEARTSTADRIRRELTAAEDKADHLWLEVSACADFLVGPVPRDAEGQGKMSGHPSFLDEVEQRLGALNWRLECVQQELARLAGIAP